MPSGWAAHLPKSPPLPHAKSSTRSPEEAVSLLALDMSWMATQEMVIVGYIRHKNCHVHDLSEMPSSQDTPERKEGKINPHGRSNRTNRSCVLREVEQLYF